MTPTQSQHPDYRIMAAEALTIRLGVVEALSVAGHDADRHALPGSVYPAAWIPRALAALSCKQPLLAASIQREWDRAEAIHWQMALGLDKFCHRAARYYGAKNDDERHDEAHAIAMFASYTAAQRYEPDTKAHFTTYALNWIRVKLSADMVEADGLPKNMNRVHFHLRAHPDLSDADVADRSGASVELVRAARLRVNPRAASGVAVNVNDVDMTQRVYDSLPAPGTDEDYEAIEARQTRAIVARIATAALARCSGVVRDTTIRAFGLDGDPPESLREIAARSGVTFQAVHLRLRKGQAAIRDALDSAGYHRDDLL